jgi:hypothetical protein
MKRQCEEDTNVPALKRVATSTSFHLMKASSYWIHWVPDEVWGLILNKLPWYTVCFRVEDVGKRLFELRRVSNMIRVYSVLAFALG